MKTSQKRCLQCQQLVFGRSDKQFCCVDCKSAYHYRQQKSGNSIYQLVQFQLRKNRAVLKQNYESGRHRIKKSEAFKKGFRPYFFTGIVDDKRINLYACFEYTFELREQFIYINKQEGQAEKVA